MTLNASLVGKNTTICGETAESHPDMVVDLHNFLNRAGLL